LGGLILCEYYVHMYANGKMISDETITKVERGDKGE
jgi:hypothetical protein